MIRIENWSVGLDPRNAYVAPELRRLVLFGTVTGHPLHDSGKELTTSALDHWDRTSVLDRWDSNGGYVVTASGTHYVLGDPDPAYEAKYPNARQRLILSLLKENTREQ